MNLSLLPVICRVAVLPSVIWSLVPVRRPLADVVAETVL